jgi:hypothetical protein
MTNTELTEYPSSRGISLARRCSLPMRRIDGMLIKNLMPNHLFANSYLREYRARTAPLTPAASTRTAPLLDDRRGGIFLSGIER